MTSDVEIQFSSPFKKQYVRLSENQRVQFRVRLTLFLVDRLDPRLRVHPLKGSYSGYWSFNINGDMRAIFLELGDTIILCACIGTYN